MGQMRNEQAFDVAVVGGGAAGICAAVQAARAGARTLLVEKNGVLGGTITAGGVAYPGLFHAYGRQVIAGIGWDLVRRSVELAGGRMPDFAKPFGDRHWLHHVRIDPAVFAALTDEAVVGSGAALRLHTMLAAAEATDAGWLLRLCGKEGLYPVAAKVLVDCTGDANAVAIAGLPLRRSGSLQAATAMAHAAGYDADALDYPAIEAAWRQALRRGEVRASDLGRREHPAEAYLRAHGENRTHLPGVDGATSAQRTEAELAARACLLRLFRFFRGQSGLEKFHYQWVAAECGIRETRTIVGRTMIAAGDYMAGRRWDDAVCNAFYPIDIHTPDGLGLDKRMLAEGIVPTVPRGAMLPEGGRRLIAAGRCISSDQEANSALRTQPTCMATGQAAGAMAALAAAADCEPADLPMAAIHDLLRQHDAILPELIR